MEAVALHDFVPTDSDDLALQKGSTLYIIDMDSDPNWYRAECNSTQGLVPFNYIRMVPNSWYLTKCTRLNAENILLEKYRNGAFVQPDGAFIVRRSEALPNGFSLSVKQGAEVMHFKIICNENGLYYIWSNKFPSINKLIEYHYRTTISKNEDLLLKDLKPSALLDMYRPHATNENRVIAMYDYQANKSDELTFNRGDVIVVTGKEDPHWLKGKLRGREGVFPLNYVQYHHTQ